MWYVYIITYSEKIDRFYVGYTANLEWRLQRHNDGWGKFTQRGLPWMMVYREVFQSKSEAIRREREIKAKKSRKYIEFIIQNK